MKKLLFAVLLLSTSHAAHSTAHGDTDLIVFILAAFATDAATAATDVLGNVFEVRINTTEGAQLQFLDSNTSETLFTPGIGTISGGPAPGAPGGNVIRGATYDNSSINITNDATTPGGER